MKNLSGRIAALEHEAGGFKSHLTDALEWGVVLSIASHLNPATIPVPDLEHFQALEARTAQLATDYGTRMGWGVVKHPQFFEEAFALFTSEELVWLLDFAERHLQPSDLKPDGMTYCHGEAIRKTRRVLLRHEWLGMLSPEDTALVEKIDGCERFDVIETSGLYLDYRRLQDSLVSHYAANGA